MNFTDIITFMKSGKKWGDIKAAQEFFESKDDLKAFLDSDWTLDDVREAYEMTETNPVAQETKPEHYEKHTTLTETTQTNFNDKEVQLGAFAKLAKGE